MVNFTTKHASAAASLLFAFFYLHVAGHDDSSSAYKPIDNILLNCGSFGNSSVLGDTRTWVGDIDSKFFPFDDLNQNNASIASQAEKWYSSSAMATVHATARLSRSEFVYSFPVSPGPKFIRLYFYSAPYRNFDRSEGLFSVKAGVYTLLHDFNASVNADVSKSDEFFKEFCVYVDGNEQKLNVTFTPTNQDSYAFVNGIEIVSMPTNLYYTSPDLNDEGGRGLKFVGQDDKFFSIENYTSLERVYRINIGGKSISPVEDTGMFRTWSEENDFLDLDNLYDDARPANLTIKLNYSKIPAYTAPEDVYRTARTMGRNNTVNKSYNLTWEYPVDPGFYYMLRFHFCEFEAEINNKPNERMFLIYVGDMIAEENADVIRWAGGKGIPYVKDYIVLVLNNKQKKVNLSVKLQAEPNDFMTTNANVILNGIEIFKLNDTSGNLAGQNPDAPTQSPSSPSIIQSKNSNSKVVIHVIILVVVGGVAVAMLALGLFVFKRRRSILMDQTSSDGTSRWTPFSISTNKSSTTRSSNLPSDLCRYFSLTEIRTATEDFNEAFIVGVGGFGNVYKGCIDNGATQVAIKRLKPGSKQGAHEFKTEIEMLSQLRHLHLVSLIGYCNDSNEMILVYDYMSHGTLRNHLYGGEEQPLTWKQRLEICIGAARGLHYLHTGAKHTIIHRDVKTTNILLDEKWVAKVSDFGLSKIGPTNMSSKAHISTVVKGSFGYLDPEYYRRQQLTKNSDVYSFGVVLCEVLCARPPLMHKTDKNKISLADWFRQCNRNNTVARIIDPNVKNEISPKCLRKFIEIAVSCIQDEGIKRPSMTDVVWGLEFALQLHEASNKKGGLDGVGGEKDDGEERWLMKGTIVTSNDDKISDSSYTYNAGISDVFSEIEDPRGR